MIFGNVKYSIHLDIMGKQKNYIGKVTFLVNFTKIAYQISNVWCVKSFAPILLRFSHFFIWIITRLHAKYWTFLRISTLIPTNVTLGMFSGWGGVSDFGPIYIYIYIQYEKRNKNTHTHYMFENMLYSPVGSFIFFVKTQTMYIRI